MNRIEMKIVVMVTNRLAAAKDSEAKTELIEELSENLYQRYQDLTACGVPEEEALTQAMENLGDVNELLEYLRDVDGGAENDAQNGAGEYADSAEETGSGKSRSHDYDKANSYNKSFHFSTEALEKNIEDIVNAAISAAKSATDYAKTVTHDVSEQMKEKYPEGFFAAYSTGQGQPVDSTEIASEKIHSVDVRLIDGDITLDFNEEENAPIEITGDTEGMQMVVRDDGTLSVRQGNTASSSFFIRRGLRSADIAICLPRRLWKNINIASAAGDIRIEEGLLCQVLAVQTTGDLDASEIQAERMAFRMTGDISAVGLNGDCYAETKSGDMDISGSFGKCGLSTAAGDVEFEGQAKDFGCSSISGDMEVTLNEVPEKAKLASKSGDCRLELPEDTGFRVRYQTTGSFECQFSMSMEQRSETGWGGQAGTAVYMDGAGGEIEMAGISGDMEILPL